MSIATQTYEGHTKGDWRNLLFILPYLIVFVGLILIPLIWGISLSFEKVDLFGAGNLLACRITSACSRIKSFCRRSGIRSTLWC